MTRGGAWLCGAAMRAWRARPLRLLAAAAVVIHVTGARGAETSCRALSEPPAGGYLDADFEQLPEVDLPATERELKIGNIRVFRQSIFNTGQQAEDKLLFRLANRLHVRTRRQTVIEQLTFREGEQLSPRLLEESERLLRGRRYLYDARVLPRRICGNRLDVDVVTRDVWTLNPSVGLDRSGGENSFHIGASESNLAGRGELLALRYQDDVDRNGLSLSYLDRNVRTTRWQLGLTGAAYDDGERFGLRLERPFFSFDARRAYGLNVERNERIDTLYETGEEVAEFQHRVTRAGIELGRGSGLVDGVAWRWRIGLRFESHQFAFEPGEPRSRQLAADRRYVYPFIALTSIEDRYLRTRNFNFLQRSEDVYLGRRWSLLLGWSDERLGADSERAVFEARFRDVTRHSEDDLLFWRGKVTGFWRAQAQKLENAVASAGITWRHRHAPAWAFYAALDASRARNLTPDRQLLLGGGNGLRGYPLRFQEGNRRIRLRLEERYYSDLHIFRLFYVGAAAFFDTGRAWFPGDPHDETSGWIADVGLGLRITTSRTVTDSVLHVDVALPLRRGGRDVEDVLIGVTLREQF